MHCTTAKNKRASGFSKLLPLGRLSIGLFLFIFLLSAQGGCKKKEAQLAGATVVEKEEKST